MKKQIENIIKDIEEYGECYIGNYNEKNDKLVKQINKAWKEKRPNTTTIVVWDSLETGMAWWVA